MKGTLGSILCWSEPPAQPLEPGVPTSFVQRDIFASYPYNTEAHLSSLCGRESSDTLSLPSSASFSFLLTNPSWYSLALVNFYAALAVAFILVSHYLPNKYLHRVVLGAQGCVLNGPKVEGFCGSTTEAQG